MFRLDVSHLQAPTISLPDFFFILGSYSVSMCVTYYLKLSRNVITTELLLLQAVIKHENTKA